jgi:hypothetical protein
MCEVALSQNLFLCTFAYFILQIAGGTCGCKVFGKMYFASLRLQNDVQALFLHLLCGYSNSVLLIFLAYFHYFFIF